MMSFGKRWITVAFCATPLLYLQLDFARSAGRWDYALTENQLQAVARISASSLRGHLSFLASDLLEGRGSGSRGQGIAAEYIAAQFLRAGLEPAGDDGYFQSTSMLRLSSNSDGYLCRFASEGKTVDIPARELAAIGMLASRAPLVRAIDLEDVPVVKIPFGSTKTPEGDLKGAVVMTGFPPTPRDRSQAAAFFAERREFLARLSDSAPALLIAVGRQDAESGYFGRTVLVDPDRRPAPESPAVASLSGETAAGLYDALRDGATRAALTLHVAAPVASKVALRNVIGLLRGSDPALSDTYVLLTAHYDGQGTRPAPDSIWNSANDNGSGTVSVIEIASALSTLKKKPRRSIVFMTYDGEEAGLIGSRFYAGHPVFSLRKTIAEVNLEMVGRTDDREGDQHKRASLTGFDYSDIGAIFRRAGELTGITVFKHERNSNAYFGASDNAPLAAKGVPAHTLCVTYQYPDYHGAADTWDKIDYDNMALTVRMIAKGLLILTESGSEPHWDASVPQAGRFLQAWQKLHRSAEP